MSRITDLEMGLHAPTEERPQDTKRPLDRLVMRAEIRNVRGPTDEYDSYLVLISGGKAWPYIHIPETMPNDVLEMALKKLNA